jgi:hypothetical protein
MVNTDLGESKVISDAVPTETSFRRHGGFYFLALALLPFVASAESSPEILGNVCAGGFMKKSRLVVQTFFALALLPFVASAQTLI